MGLGIFYRLTGVWPGPQISQFVVPHNSILSLNCARNIELNTAVDAELDDCDISLVPEDVGPSAARSAILEDAVDISGADATSRYALQPGFNLPSYPMAIGDGIAPAELFEFVLISDLTANHKLLVASTVSLTKKGGFPSYDFDGPASTSKLGLFRGDKLHLLSGGAANHGRILTIRNVGADVIEVEEALLPGDGAVEFDFELIRRKG